MNKMTDKLKEFFQEKKNIYLTIGITAALIVIIVIIIILCIIFKRYSYSEIEQMMVNGTKEYFQNHREYNPTKEQPFFDMDSTSLIAEKYLKEFKRLTSDTNCHGNVKITYNNGSLRYVPNLTCDDYETKSLYDKVMEKEDIVTSGDGLYKIDDVYRYKGDIVNNYVSFANKSWRLFKITKDNILYLVLADTVNDKNSAVVFDDRYNEEAKGDKGYNIFDSSRIKVTLNKIYNNDFANYKAYLLDYEACKNSRSEMDTDMTGAIECFTTTTTPISLMAVYDYIGGSRDYLCLNTVSQNCLNYNYLTATKNKWWLLNGTNENSYKVYAASQNGGNLQLENANLKKNLRYVITIPGEVIYKSGNGTKDKPYTIYEY